MDSSLSHAVLVQTPVKRRLSLEQVVLLNLIVCGLEFCASAAFTYIPPMLLKAGLSESHMSIVMGVGPLLGFIIVPILGRASDRCRSKYGRRRPFILGLSLMLLVSLLIIPYGELFGIYLSGEKRNFSKYTGLTLLIVGAVLLDFSSQACLTPCEALLSDACKDTNQQDRCFMVYSFMVSIGGCIGYLITALDWSSSTVGLYFGSQERSAFSVLVVLFTFTMTITLLVAQEQPIDTSGTFKKLQQNSHEKRTKSASSKQSTYMINSPGEYTQAVNTDVIVLNPNDPGYESGSTCEESLLTESVDTRYIDESCCDIVPMRLKQCHIPLVQWTFTNFESFTRLLVLKLIRILPRPIKHLLYVPFVLKRLALANLCSWTAVMGFNLFFTDFVGQAVYGGDPNAAEDSHLRTLYDEGVRMGSWGLLFHCITSASCALFIERVVNRMGTRNTYFLGMLSFTAAMGTMVFVRNVYLVILMAACTGFGYATVTIIPFALITTYHDDKQLYFSDSRSTTRGIGADMATLDSAYFLSQVILAIFMGYVVDMTGTVLAYVVCACGIGAVSCASITRIVCTKEQMSGFIKSGAVYSVYR